MSLPTEVNRITRPRLRVRHKNQYNLPSYRIIQDTFRLQSNPPEVVCRMANSDRIPLSADRSISVVHPIPVDWLREDLLPNERGRVREHVGNLLSGNPTQPPSFIEALQRTIANLNTVNNMGTTTRAIPARRQDSDSMTTEESRSIQSPSRSVRFSDHVRMDRVSRDPRELGPHSPQSSSPTPRSILRSPGHSRSNSNSYAVDFGVTSRGDVDAHSRTSVHLDELDDLDTKLDEIDDAITGEMEIDEGDATECLNSDVTVARPITRKL